MPFYLYTNITVAALQALHTLQLVYAKYMSPMKSRTMVTKNP